MEQLKTLNFEDKTVRTINRDGEMWWVLADVCNVLEISDTSNVAKRLDEDEKGTYQISTLGGNQDMLIISESGLYNVILRSDKPKAKPFRKWVTSEVLPSIRKTGAYSVQAQPDNLPEQSPVILRMKALESMIADYWRATDEKYVKLRNEVSEARIEQLQAAYRAFKGKEWLEGVPPELLERIDEVLAEWGKV
jgi:prophage antirepressor-like protein